MRLSVVSLVVFAGYVSLPGFAASFDCAHPAGPRERAICDDKALSALDDKLDHDYRAALARLTPNGTNLLRQAQRGWLGFISVVCPIAKPEASHDNPSLTPVECLTDAYKNRIEALLDSGKQIGPFTFVRIDHFAAERAPDGSGTLLNPDLYEYHLNYPQIDQPLSDAARSWNQMAAKPFAKAAMYDGPLGNEDDGSVVRFATSRLISMTSSTYTYYHGTPLGFRGVHVETTVLDTPPHKLAVEDLFGPDSINERMRKLQDMFWSAELSAGFKPALSDPTGVENSLREAVTHPASWVLTPTGLQFVFGSYAGGCYACPVPVVTVTWAQLRPILAKTAPVP